MNVKIISYLIFVSILFSPLVSAFSEQQLIQKATDEFNRYVPLEYRYEYVYSYIEPASERDGTHNVVWERRLNGIKLWGDRVVIRVFDTTGNIDFEYIKRDQNITNVDLEAVLTSDQTKWIINRAYKGTLTEEPTIVIDNKRLIWQIQMDLSDGKTHIWVDIDAKTGETIRFTQSRGSSVSQIATRFDATQYYLDIYGSYIFLLAVIFVGGAFYFWKHPFSQNKK